MRVYGAAAILNQRLLQIALFISSFWRACFSQANHVQFNFFRQFEVKTFSLVKGEKTFGCVVVIVALNKNTSAAIQPLTIFLLGPCGSRSTVINASLQ